MDDNARRRRRLPFPRFRPGLAAVLAGGLALAACSSSGSTVEPPTDPPEGPQDIRIGALLPETGPDAATGVAARWLLETRLEELNALAAARDPSYTFELEIVDTESDPAVAREALDELADEGVRVVVGPFSDAEVKAVADLADRRGVLIASPGSSAISLALVDNVLRFVPDDDVQAAALVDLVRRDGISTVAPITRADPTNADLQVAVADELRALGGSVVEPVAYAPDATNYRSPIESLAERVADAGEVLGDEHAGALGIVLAGEDEVPQILTLAASTPGLVDLRWFGSSGIAGSPSIVTNPSAAAFAAAVGLAAASFGLDPATEDRWAPLVQQGKERTGVEPDGRALAAFDALDLLVTAILDSGFEATEETTNADVRALRTAVISASLAADGVTGPLKLNESGDRTTGVFDFWSVCEGPTGYEWRRTAVWAPGPDGLTGGTITGSAVC